MSHRNRPLAGRSLPEAVARRTPPAFHLRDTSRWSSGDPKASAKGLRVPLMFSGEKQARRDLSIRQNASRKSLSLRHTSADQKLKSLFSTLGLCVSPRRTVTLRSRAFSHPTGAHCFLFLLLTFYHVSFCFVFIFSMMSFFYLLIQERHEEEPSRAPQALHESGGDTKTREQLSPGARTSPKRGSRSCLRW